MNVISRTAAVFFITRLQSCPYRLSLQSTEFSFQGSLKNGTNPANGSCHFEFALFDTLTASSQIGATISRKAVSL